MALKLWAFLLFAALAVSAGTLEAATVNLTFDTVSNADSTVITNTDGSTYYNELSGGVAPTPVSGAGQAAIGNGSWQASGSGGYHNLTVYQRNTGAGGINSTAYTGFNGAANIRIRDIASFSFETNQPTGSSLADWNVTIYTAPDAAGGPNTGFTGYAFGADDSATWYGRRMLFEPAYAYNFSGPKDVFNTWTTDSGINQFGMYDKSPGPAGNTGGYVGGPTLADVEGGPVFWMPGSEGGLWPVSGLTKGASGSSQTLGVDYRNEIVNLLRLNIGSPNNHLMLLDNFSFTLKSEFDAGVDPNLIPGQTVILDFEDPNFVAAVLPAPEPSSLALLGLGAFCLLRRRR